MSSSEENIVTTFDFKDSLNESSISKTNFVRSIGNDEFLLIFDSYFVIYRLIPFHKSALLTDKFPVKILRFDFETQSTSTPTILQHSLNLLQYSDVDSNFARVGMDAACWREITETVADAVFLQPSVSSQTMPSTSAAGGDSDSQNPSFSSVVISEIFCQSDETIDRQLFFIVLADGRLFADVKTGWIKDEPIALTPILVDRIRANVDTFGAEFPELQQQPSTSRMEEEAAKLSGLKNIQRLGCVLSTKLWFPTNLRIPSDDGFVTYGISVQRSGHLIVWSYNISSTDWQKSFRIIDILDGAIGKTITSGNALEVNEKKCFVLFGTSDGETLSLPFFAPFEPSKHRKEPLHRVLQDDYKLWVSIMRIFPVDASRRLLIVGRQSFLTAAILKVTNADFKVIASKSVRIKHRFAAFDIVRCLDGFLVISADRMSKFEINCNKGLSLKELPDSVVLQDGIKAVGHSFSKNHVLSLEATMRKHADRYGKWKPLLLRINKTMAAEQFWDVLMAKGHLKDAADFFIVLRYLILHPEYSKIIGDFLINDLESEESNVLLKLKVFRFATMLFSGKRIKADDLEFWNRVREKIERLLVVRIAKTMLQRARRLDWSEPMPAVRRATASLIDFLSAEGVEVVNEFGQLQRPQCPLCDAESFQTGSLAEHACANGHRYPACSMTFLPIRSFDYRKCSRCDLAVLDKTSLTELSDLIPDMDYCQFCDGRIL